MYVLTFIIIKGPASFSTRKSTTKCIAMASKISSIRAFAEPLNSCLDERLQSLFKCPSKTFWKLHGKEDPRYTKLSFSTYKIDGPKAAMSNFV